MIAKQEARIRPVFFLVILFLIPNLLFLLIYAMSYYFSTDSFNNEYLVLKKEGIIVVLDAGEAARHHDKNPEKFIAHELTRILTNARAGELQTSKCDEKVCKFTIYGAEADRLRQIITPFLKQYPRGSGYVNMIYNLRTSNELVKIDLY